MSELREKELQQGVDAARIEIGALLGTVVFATFQIMQLEKLDKLLHWSAICYAVSIPLLASCLLAISPNPNRSNLHVSAMLFGLCTGGNCALIGLALNFFHISTTAGIIFVIATVLGLAIYLTKPPSAGI